MALGCFLWISGICFLLFNGSVGLPAKKGYGYRYKIDSSNLGDDVEDEALMSDWQASNEQQSGAAYTSYNNPSGAWQPVAAQQTVPQMSSQPQNPVDSLKENVFVRVSDSILPPPPPPPPPSSYIVQSRDAYQRVGFLLNKSRYSPGFAPPLAVRSGPARRQPAAPVGVKSPQRTLRYG